MVPDMVVIVVVDVLVVVDVDVVVDVVVVEVVVAGSGHRTSVLNLIDCIPGTFLFA